MSTTHHQVAGKRNSSEACDFTGENTLGRETLYFFGVVASVCVPADPRVDLGKLSAKNRRFIDSLVQ
jgi:hypothetical protein